MDVTIVLFAFALVARIWKMMVNNVFFRHQAQISLRDGFIYVTIPTNLTWSPGMHVFLRFAHIRPFESHPFTILSIPTPDDEGLNQMLFMIRPVAGFTSVLAGVAATVSPKRKLPVILDGPYGETGANTLNSYDSILLFAGGTGITYIAPLLADLVRAMEQNGGPCKVVEVCWTVRSIGE